MKKSVVSDVVAERFSVDFIGKKISGTKASFDKAKKGNGPIYEELARKVANHPDFALVEILPKKPAKVRETYKGMDIPFMLAYLEMKGNKEAALKLEKVIAFAKKQKMKPYPLAKKYFLKPFTDKDGVVYFDYAKVKDEVEAYRINKTEAEKKTASTEDKQPDPAEKPNTIIPNPANTELTPAENF